jgi:hypothetical protein
MRAGEGRPYAVAPDLGALGLGLETSDLRCRFQGRELRFWGQDLGFRVEGLDFSGLGLKVTGLGFPV